MLVNGEKPRINEIEINDKDCSLKGTSISMNMVSKAKLCSDKEAESGAERYANLLNAPECRQFFLKVMYHLPYDIRERILEAATKPWIKIPKKYFTYCAKKELTNLGF